MERSLAEQEDRYVESIGTVTQDMIRIYRALGGGCDPGPANLEAEVQNIATEGEPIF